MPHPATPARNTELDGLRGLAIALVVLYHLNLLGMGWVGVQLFFVLSGFLITRLLLEQRSNQPLGRYLKTFYGRRALRIFPLYYVYLLLLLAFFWALPQGQQAAVQSQWPYAASYTLNWQAMTPGYEKTYFLSHFWSLAIEEQFYLFWPLLLFALPRRVLPLMLLALVLAGPLLRLAVHRVWGGLGLAEAADLPQALALSTLSHLDAFAIGGLLCCWGEGLARLRRPALWLALAALLVWGAGAAVNGAGWRPQQPLGAYFTLGYPNSLPLSSQWLWGYTAINGLCALLLGLVLHAGMGRWLFTRGWLVWLGRVSYGVYVLHFPLAHLTSGAVYRIHDWTGAGLYVCLLLYAVPYLCLLLGLALLSHEGLERPCLRLKQRWFPLRSAAQSAA